MIRPFLLLATTLLFPGFAAAHEYWLLPDAFAAPQGQPIGIAHRVGTGWPGETLPRDPRRVVRFALIDARGAKTIDGEPGADPAGLVELRTPGLSMAVYESRPTPISLEPVLFENYLKDEGLDAVAAWRASHGESDKPGLEMFSRNAKTLLVATGGRASKRDWQAWKRPAGLALELVPKTDPRRLRPGGAFKAQLLYRGKPLEGALVKAFPKDGNERKLAARTDAQGRVSFTLPEGGVWLISTVHMVDAPPGSGSRWASAWSSLTFEVARR